MDPISLIFLLSILIASSAVIVLYISLGILNFIPFK